MDSNTLTTHQIGTIGYIPSEILSQPALRSPLQDIYACGMILYEAFAGHLADPADYKPLALVRAELSVLDPIITAAIAGQNQRITSAKLFGDRIKQVIRNLQQKNEITETIFQAPFKISNIQNNFSEDDLQIFRLFSDALVSCYSQIRKDAKFVSSYEEIDKALQELYDDVCLDVFVSDIPQLTQSFVSGIFYYKEQQIYVSDLKLFIELLRNGAPAKRSLIMRNIISKLKRVKSYSVPVDDDLPF